MKKTLLILCLFSLVMLRCSPPDGWRGHRGEHLLCTINVPPNYRAAKIASGFVPHRETSRNSSPLIDYWNARLGLPPGTNYCAAFQTFVLDSAKVNYPLVRSARSRDFITRHSIPAGRIAPTDSFPPGYLVIWRHGNSSTGHVEMIRRYWVGYSGYTIGANTSPSPDLRDDPRHGVFFKYRRIDHTAHFRITHITPVY